jgi:hypothetical protein
MIPFTNSPLLSYAVSTATPCSVMLHRSYISCVLRARVQLPDELKHLRGEARSVICPSLRWCEHPWSPTFPSSINGATLISELWNTRNRVPEALWPVFFRWRYQDIHRCPLRVSVTVGVNTSGSVCTVRITGTSGSTCADKSLAQPPFRCVLFDGENFSFDASLDIYK